MATDYPTALDTYTDPASSNKLNNPSHSVQHQNHNDSVEAIEAKLGTGASTPTSGKVLRATGTGTSVWGAADVTTDITGTLPVTNGGTGRATSTTAYGLLAAGTTATGAHQTLAAGATTEILVGGGASAVPVWTTAQGSGAPVRATSPTLTTPNLGTPSAVVLTNATGLPTAGILDANVTGAKISSGATGVGNANLLTTAGDIGGAWLAYTPTFVSITVGAGGTVSGAYTKIGKTIHFWAYFKFGTGSAVGGASVSLPITSVSPVSANKPIGTVTYFDNSAGSVYDGPLLHTNTTTALLRTHVITAAAVTYLRSDGISSTTPITWATDDTIILQGTYDAA